MAESSPTSPKPRWTRKKSMTRLCFSVLIEELQCGVCLDVFSDPVSTPCGHNFCRICLKQYWDNSQIYSCPYCKETFSKRPELKINTTLREVTLIFKEKFSLRRSETDIQQMIQKRIKKIEYIKQSAELRKRSREQEKAASVKLFSDMINSIERCQTELLETMEEEEKQDEDLIKVLEQEITELKWRDSELKKIKHSEDYLHLIQVNIGSSSLYRAPDMKNWSEISMKTHVSVETLRRALTQLQETLNEKLTQTVLMKMQQYAVDVTLDPDTAHPKLILSKERKQVRHGDIKHELPDNPERFYPCVYVLGKEGFASGRFYFEVQVKDKTDWDLGVARESINRKGAIIETPQNGFWTVQLRNENEYKALAGPPVSLCVKVKPQKVGVFVDYEEGLVCFYDVESRSHIYSFTDQTFNEKLFPFFSPCNNDKGKNSAPLIISPVHYN
ncbi:zinc-binding protein A33-like [Misgurnus anguillicaudatus]|uniref:zinc-binding protein A33-like n=1 Tax=Misgurnus anguillicaudatus TaxID=75329 RepID=UPI003CCF513C